MHPRQQLCKSSVTCKFRQDRGSVARHLRQYLPLHRKFKYELTAVRLNSLMEQLDCFCGKLFEGCGTPNSSNELPCLQNDLDVLH